MRLPKWAALAFALRKAKTKEERTRVKRKIGAVYAKRKPKARKPDASGGYQPTHSPKNPLPPPTKL